MNFIVVVDRSYGIGKNNGLLTHLTDDLKYFRRTTLGKVVVMGRKTLDSLPGGKPFDKRINIVLTRDKSYTNEYALVVHSFDELFEQLRTYETEDVFICGGGQIYNALYPYCEYGYITKIQADFDADTTIDCIEALPNWELVEESPEMINNGYTFTWTKYHNKSVKEYQ